MQRLPHVVSRARVLALGLLSLVSVPTAARAQEPPDVPRGYERVGDLILPIGFYEQEGLQTGNPWPNAVVPYEQPTLDALPLFQRNATYQAFAEIEGLSGARFVPFTTENDRIYFVSTTNSNSSFLGRVGGRQRVELSTGAGRYTTVHELMHALSVHHEHQRPDRDNFITVHWNEIQPGFANQFTIANGTIHTAYDFDSVMHYDAFAFAIGSQPTITANAQPAPPFGQSSHMSLGDATTIRAIYGTGTPFPAINTVVPLSLPQNGLGLYTLTLTGQSFVPQSFLFPSQTGSEVHWGTTVLPTTWVDRNTLTALVGSSLLHTAGTVQITVVNRQLGLPDKSSNLLTVNVAPRPSNTTWIGTHFGAGRFGHTLEIVGDVTGDGWRETLVSTTTTQWGFVDVMNPFDGSIVRSHSGIGGFGGALVELGDVNHDTVSDYAVGSPTEGKVFAFSGLNGSSLWTLSGPPGSNFGSSLENVGDVDSDGNVDIAIGDRNTAGHGRVTVHTASTGNQIYAIAPQPPAANGDNFGHAVVALGGNLIAVGAPNYNTLGSVFVYALGPTSASLALVRAGGSIRGGYGWTLAAPGDVDRDGTSDVAIGQQNVFHPQGNQSGYVEIVSVANNNQLGLFGSGTNLDGFAEAMTSIGDIDGDGLSEIAIGAPFASTMSGQNFGQVHVYTPRACSPFCSNNRIALFNGVTQYAWFGLGLAGGKSIFSTGAPDLIIAQPGFQASVGLTELISLATVTRLGDACTTAATPPRISAEFEARPVIGVGTVVRTVTGYSGSGTFAGAMFLSFGNVAPSSIGFGCTAYIDLLSSVSLPSYTIPAASLHRMPIAIPNDPGLLGLIIMCQAILAPTPHPLGFDVTNGLLLRVGAQ